MGFRVNVITARVGGIIVATGTAAREGTLMAEVTLDRALPPRTVEGYLWMIPYWYDPRGMVKVIRVPWDRIGRRDQRRSRRGGRQRQGMGFLRIPGLGDATPAAQDQADEAKIRWAGRLRWLGIGLAFTGVAAAAAPYFTRWNPSRATRVGAPLAGAAAGTVALMLSHRLAGDGASATGADPVAQAAAGT